MEHGFDNVIDALIAILLLFLVPLLYFGLKQDSLTKQLLDEKTVNFVENVRTQGSLTKSMYETYRNEIEKIQVIGDVQIKHKALILEPEYRLKTVKEVIEEQDSSWDGDNTYTYVPVTTERPQVTDPINPDGIINTETNESVLATATDGSSDPGHIHDSGCYVGHTHNSSCYSVHYHTGNSSSGGGCYGGVNYNYHTHKSSCYHTHSSYYCYTNKTCGGSATYSHSGSGNYGSTLCPTCGESVDDGYVEYYKCSTCGASMGGIYHNLTTYHCGKKLRNGSGTTNNVKSSCTASRSVLTCTISTTDPICGKTTSTIEGISSYYINCGKSSGTSYLTCGKSVDTSPDCNQLIIGISPTHPIQTVYLNNPLITTATVTYKNGSTKVLISNSNFITNIIVQNQTVNLSYSNSIEGVSYGPYTCTITVTVIPKTKTCNRGHTYNLNYDGSDPGCIYCDSWLEKLDVLSPSSKILTIYKGANLEDKGVIILATYLNGRTESLTTGYAHNLDPHYLGSQNVTISYKGLYTTLKVITKRNLALCGTCGKLYELYPDGTDPGCPYCAALIPIFTGNVLKYYSETYSSDIEEELYNGTGAYNFKVEDFINLTVTKKNESIGSKLLGIIPGMENVIIRSEYGGKIRDESLYRN
jgi:hypothetical protein